MTTKINVPAHIREYLIGKFCNFEDTAVRFPDSLDAETMLATVKVARLAAYYEYDVTLMNLLALCGTPEQFRNYAVK